MNIGHRIMLAGFQDPMSSDHFETFQVGTPIPTAHPPSLKHAPRVAPDTAQEGWRNHDSKRKKKRAREDLHKIVQKTLNQGRSTLVNHSKGSDPNLWNPSQIADL